MEAVLKVLGVWIAVSLLTTYAYVRFVNPSVPAYPRVQPVRRGPLAWMPLRAIAVGGLATATALVFAGSLGTPTMPVRVPPPVAGLAPSDVTLADVSPSETRRPAARRSARRARAVVRERADVALRVARAVQRSAAARAARAVPARRRTAPVSPPAARPVAVLASVSLPSAAPEPASRPRQSARKRAPARKRKARGKAAPSPSQLQAPAPQGNGKGKAKVKVNRGNGNGYGKAKGYRGNGRGKAKGKHKR